MKAVNEALESPLLDSNDIYGTQNILLNIISGKDEITIGEIGEIIEVLQEKAGKDADIIWGNGYDESLEEEISVTILATGFVTNPNQLLQPKKEPEKYNLGEENNESREMEKEPVEVEAESDFSKTVMDAEKNENEGKWEVQEEKKKTSKTLTDRPLFSTKRKKRKKKKQKADEPVAQSNIDNWFYKNFGLGKLFEDDDQSLDE
jgi:cell division protein FtsZ